jgi:hypothetical protein
MLPLPPGWGARVYQRSRRASVLVFLRSAGCLQGPQTAVPTHHLSAVGAVMNNVMVAQIQRTIPHSAINALLPQWRPWDQFELRREFASWVARQKPFDTWQDAWNAWTRATQQRPGRVDMWIRCSTCKGRRYALRHGAMRPCWTCTGRGREHIYTIALWAKPTQRRESL